MILKKIYFTSHKSKFSQLYNSHFFLNPHEFKVWKNSKFKNLLKFLNGQNSNWKNLFLLQKNNIR